MRQGDSVNFTDSFITFRLAIARVVATVWREVIASYPDLGFWVAHNKTVPLGILRELAGDPDPRVRGMVVGRAIGDRFGEPEYVTPSE